VLLCEQTFGSDCCSTARGISDASWGAMMRRSMSGLGLGDGIVDHTRKWMSVSPRTASEAPRRRFADGVKCAVLCAWADAGLVAQREALR